MTASATPSITPDLVVVGASDVEATTAFFVALGMEERHRIPLTAEVSSALFGLEGPSQEVVLGTPGATGGGVLVIGTSVPQADRDDFFRGGHAIDYYTTDIHRSVAVAQEAGAKVGPVADYTFGPVQLTQAMAIGPDGLPIVFVGIDHRLPSVLDQDASRLHSEVHSVVASVDDIAAETAFWTEVAGFELKSQFPIDLPAVSEFMMLPRHAPVKMSVMTGPGAQPPRFELLAYDDADGRLVPSRPLSAGAIVPVFAVAPFDDFLARATAAGATVEAGAVVTGARIVPLRSPGGVDVLVRDAGEAGGS